MPYGTKQKQATKQRRVSFKATWEALWRMSFGHFPLILPGARIIHARRDPVDTCLSCYTKLFAGEQPFAYDQAELGALYRSYARLMAHWRTVLPPERFIEVDYEAVVDDLEGRRGVVRVDGPGAGRGQTAGDCGHVSS